MKYIYKTISTIGFDTFKNYYENLVKDYQDEQKNIYSLFSITRYIKDNPEGFSFVKNLSKKYGDTITDYLNYYGSLGWKIISYNPAQASYLIMKEENTPAEKLDQIPEISEKDLQLKEFEVSFTSSNESIKIPESINVREGYILKIDDLKELSTNSFKRTVYRVNGTEIKSGYVIREKTVIDISIEKKELNYQLC